MTLAQMLEGTIAISLIRKNEAFRSDTPKGINAPAMVNVDFVSTKGHQSRGQG